MGFVLPWPIQVGGVTNVLKTQIFPSENSGWPDQVFPLVHIPQVTEEYVEIRGK